MPATLSEQRIATIAAWLRVFVAADQVFEVRALGDGMAPLSGCFLGKSAAIAAAIAVPFGAMALVNSPHLTELNSVGLCLYGNNAISAPVHQTISTRFQRPWSQADSTPEDIPF